MRANFVDTLMARLDGEVATIWATVLLRLDERPDASHLRRGLRALVRENPRLNVGWNDALCEWLPVPRTDAEADAALLEGTVPLDEHEAVSQVINARMDLSRELPLRLHLLPMEDSAQGPWMLAIQLHHAIGDAKALGHLLERLWALCSGRAAEGPPLAASTLTDGKVLQAALRRPGQSLGVASPRRRLLALRGLGLRRSGDVVGRSIMATARFRLPPERPELSASDVFFASLLASAALREPPRDGVIRLRMPVDLRRELGLGRTLGNGCSAVPIELPFQEVHARLEDPPRLVELVRSEIQRVLETGVHWATALECMAVARVAPRRVLRQNARPGLIAEPRTNTLVTTYMGRLDRHFAGAPLRIRSVRSHTPTWGATGFTFQETLCINPATFEGLWSPSELREFTQRLADWVSSSFDLPAEVVGP
ncbi:hypothetical protein [Hyalangium versicolor]|uniref:hypothetical protein n=1 Tax=Hyalangium versicolor TaxID=2861190 RepID=UPI001CCAB306|nr:hypothetical protein [Hyalangium versicolor]